jgi:hypothetical protein
MQLPGTSLMIITSTMATTYNDITRDKINPTKMTFSILFFPYGREDSFRYEEIRSIDNDTIRHQQDFKSRML